MSNDLRQNWQRIIHIKLVIVIVYVWHWEICGEGILDEVAINFSGIQVSSTLKNQYSAKWRKNLCPSPAQL